MRTFGDTLRQARRGLRKTLLDLAEASNLSVTYVSQIERGERNPPDELVIRKWLAVLNCPQRLGEFVELARNTMTRVNVPLDTQRKEANDVMMSLARRYEENTLNEDVWKSILTLIKQNGAPGNVPTPRKASEQEGNSNFSLERRTRFVS